MYSNRSEDGQRRPHGDRRPKQRDRRDDSWEKRHEPHRGFLRDAFRTHGADGHSDSPQRQYSRDGDGRSPPRRPESSPVWDASEKKRRRYSDEEKSDPRYQHERQKTTYRQAADSFPDSHATRKYREAPQDFRHRHRPEEFDGKRHDGAAYRRYRERDGRERSRDRSPVRLRSQERLRSEERFRSQERLESPDRYTQTPVKPRRTPERPAYPEDRRRPAELWQNGASKQAHEGAVTTKCVKVPRQEQTKGFQRFLDVLNKGVNVDTLTKIVTQSSTGVTRQPPNCLPRAVDQSWTGRHASPRDNRRSPRNRSISPMGGLRREDQVRLQEETTPTTEDQNKCRQVQDVLQAIGMDLGFEELGQMSHRIQERLYGRKDGDLGRRVSKETGSRPSNSPRRRSGSSSSRSGFTPLPRDGLMKQDSFSAQTDSAEGQHTQKTHQGQSAEYRLDSGSQEGQYEMDSGFQEGQYRLDSGSQEGQYRLDSGSQEGQSAELDSWPQHDRFRRNSGSESESCDSASPQQSASPFTYAPSVCPPPPSVHPPAPMMAPYPPALLFPPLPSLPPAMPPHVPPGMFLPQPPPFFPGAALGQPGPTFRNPPPLNPLFRNPPPPLNLPFPPPLNPSFSNPPPLNPSFSNPPPLTPTFSNPPPLNPSFSNPPPLNPTFPNPLFLNTANGEKAVQRQRYLQVIETKPG